MGGDFAHAAFRRRCPGVSGFMSGGFRHQPNVGEASGKCKNRPPSPKHGQPDAKLHQQNTQMLGRFWIGFEREIIQIIGTRSIDHTPVPP